MSAPDTNVEKQERRHKPSLLGIKGVMIFVALLLIGFVFYASVTADDRADDGTGATTLMEPAAVEPSATSDTAPAGN